MSNVFRRGLATVLVVACAAGAQATELRAGTFKPARAAPELALRGSDGTELKLARYRGKVVLLGFGYTTCPDVCPTTLFNLAQARAKLGAEARNMQVVYVTVDPARDTPERMKAYLDGFDPSFVGGTGTDAQLAAARKNYGITVTREDVPGGKGAYWMHHSSFIYLIDQAGNIRALLPFGVTVDDIVHDVKALLEG